MFVIHNICVYIYIMSLGEAFTINIHHHRGITSICQSPFNKPNLQSSSDLIHVSQPRGVDGMFIETAFEIIRHFQFDLPEITRSILCSGLSILKCSMKLVTC